MPPADTTLFEDAIDVPLWLEADDETPFAQRVRRDRGIALTLDTRDSLPLVRGWRRALTPAPVGGAGARLERARGLIALAMAVLGLLAGTSLALAAFQYDGSQPVNVVRLLALLVGLQLVFLVLTLLLSLPGRLPFLRGLQEMLAALNPGAWAASLLARFRGDDAARELFDWRGRAGATRFAKWQVLTWSQVAAVAFNLAALATAFALVTFSDLAFGWSTTLTVDPMRVTRMAGAIAWPWQALVPAAVPDALLVEQSQFFRLSSVDGGLGSDSRALTGWWPFTICAMLFYGLIPRLAMLGFARWRLRAATQALLLDNPRVTALVDRMRAPSIETEADSHEEHRDAAAAPARRPDRAPGGRAVAIVWENSVAPDAVRQEARQRFGSDIDTVLAVGGARGLDADRRTLEGIGPLADESVLIFTPAWEPPVLELLDFLTALRSQIGDAVSIVVVPMPDGDRNVTEVERRTWQRAVGRLGDPRLYVEAGHA